MKNTFLTSSLSLALTSSLFAFDYQIKSEPNLLGAVDKITDFTVFENKCVNYIYYQDFSKLPNIEWAYRSINTSFPQSGVEINEIEKGKGFLVEASGNCNVTVQEEIPFGGNTYGTVVSPVTQRVWLDKNLGASEICTKTRSEFSTDLEYENSQKSCFGDYYQWGRQKDGHQIYNSLTTTSLKDDHDDPGSKFIKTDSSYYDYDWLRYHSNGNTRSTYWQKTDKSGICPEGFRVPSITELNAEKTNLTAFIEALKIPLAGKEIDQLEIFIMKGV